MSGENVEIAERLNDFNRGETASHPAGSIHGRKPT
jgi:hypothetical protein